MNQSTHQLLFEVLDTESHYKNFRNENKIIKEAVLDVESFKKDFPNISSQNEERCWSNILNPPDIFLPEIVLEFMHLTEHN